MNTELSLLGLLASALFGATVITKLSHCVLDSSHDVRHSNVTYHVSLSSLSELVMLKRNVVQEGTLRRSSRQSTL